MEGIPRAGWARLQGLRLGLLALGFESGAAPRLCFWARADEPG